MDLTGDPWDGITLEWSIASPPPEYNFAVIPKVEDIDAFWDMKEKGTAYQRPKEYHDIHMPKNTPLGIVIGVLTLSFGFAMVWYIWWLAIVSLVAIVATVIKIASNDDVEYVIPAAEVKKIEDERFRILSENLEQMKMNNLKGESK